MVCDEATKGHNQPAVAWEYVKSALSFALRSKRNFIIDFLPELILYIALDLY